MTDVSKITASHRERLCLVYVRQSTLAQTRVSTESLERQYELAGRAVALGWDRERVRVVDADLGLSGADAAGREGFQHLVSEVALGRAGLIIGRELEKAVLAEVFATLEPAALAATAQALADAEAARAERLKAFELAVERARYGRPRPPPVRRLRAGEPAGGPHAGSGLGGQAGRGHRGPGLTRRRAGPPAQHADR